jgi:hypothetical protein
MLTRIASAVTLLNIQSVRSYFEKVEAGAAGASSVPALPAPGSAAAVPRV